MTWLIFKWLCPPTFQTNTINCLGMMPLWIFLVAPFLTEGSLRIPFQQLISSLVGNNLDFKKIIFLDWKKLNLENFVLFVIKINICFRFDFTNSFRNIYQVHTNCLSIIQSRMMYVCLSVRPSVCPLRSR